MNTQTLNLEELQLRLSIVVGLITMLFIIFLAGDIWVWRGIMLGELGQWVKEEGGEEAFWGAAIFYGLIATFAFSVMLFEQQWFRWLSLLLLVLLSASSVLKTISGLQEYDQEGWYFFALFCLQNLISLVLIKLAYQWARLPSTPNSEEGSTS